MISGEGVAMIHLVKAPSHSERYLSVHIKKLRDYICNEFETASDYFICRKDLEKKVRIPGKHTIELAAERKTLS